MSTPQPAAAPVFSMSGRIGVWVHVTETMTGHIHDIQAAGFDYILLKIADGSAGANTYHLAALQRIVHDAATVNIPLVAWAYVTPTDIPGQVAAILKALPAGVNDLVLDAEIEFEQAAAPGGSLGPATTIMRIHQLCQALLAGRKGLRLHLSSFWSTKFHASLPFRTFAQHCATLQPQCYLETGSRSAHEILDGALTQWGALVTKGKNAVLPTINNTQFVPILKAKQFTAFNVYCFDPKDGDAEVGAHLATWKAAIAQFRAK